VSDSSYTLYLLTLISTWFESGVGLFASSPATVCTTILQCNSFCVYVSVTLVLQFVVTRGWNKRVNSTSQHCPHFLTPPITWATPSGPMNYLIHHTSLLSRLYDQLIAPYKGLLFEISLVSYLCIVTSSKTIFSLLPTSRLAWLICCFIFRIIFSTCTWEI